MKFQRHLLLSATTLVFVSLFSGCATRSSALPDGARHFTLTPSRESPPSSITGADADDVAFWRHPDEPTRNLVFATQKLGGLSVYDTDGRRLLDALPGDVRYNNVDIIHGFPWAEGVIDLVVFSERLGDTLHAYRVLPEAPYLQRLPDADPAFRVFGGTFGEDTAYGLCLWRDERDDTTNVFVTQNDTRVVRQFALREQNGALTISLQREFQLMLGEPNAHAEGLVVDPLTRRLYIAQEDVGIYQVELDAWDDRSVIELDAGQLWQTASLPYLTPDIEGLALLPTGPDSGYLIASSQGSNTFAIYERMSLQLAGVFSVVGNKTIDGSEECDGLDVTPYPWGTTFPNGVLIVHDGVDQPTGLTNFKWIDVKLLLEQLDQ